MNLQLYTIIVSCFVFVLSCSENKWPEEVQGGVSFFDGVEYRETGFRYLSAGRQWRLLHISDSQSNDYVQCDYSSQKMVSKKKSTAYVSFSISIPYEIFCSRKVFTSKDEDFSHDSANMTFTTDNFYRFYETTDWELSIEPDALIHSYNDLFIVNDYYSGTFEYEMSVVDSLGISHQISGWAEYINN